MARFRYQAINKAGKSVAGVLEAESPQLAQRELRAGGLYPTTIRQERGRTRAPKTTEELATTLLLLAKLLGGGLPLDRALELLAEETQEKRLKAALLTVLEEVRAGSDLASAFAHSRAFPPLVIEMIRAGEASGQLAPVLEELALHLAEEQRQKQEIKSALLYPIILLVAALGSVGFLFVFLLPRLAELFQDFGQELPFSTRLLIQLGTWLSHNWLLALGALALLLLFAFSWLRRPEAKAAKDGLFLKLPFLGPVFIYTYTARLAATFATLLKGGVPLADAFPIVGAAVGNEVYKGLLASAEEKVREGERLAGALGENPAFPQLAAAMIAAGEEAGNLAQMLEHLGETYQYRADLGRKTLLSLLEPMVILVMGLIVGFVVLSVLLPIFELNSHLN